MMEYACNKCSKTYSHRGSLWRHNRDAQSWAAHDRHFNDDRSNQQEGLSHDFSQADSQATTSISTQTTPTDVACHKNNLDCELGTSKAKASNNEGEKTRFIDSGSESSSEDSQSSNDDSVTSSLGSEQSVSQQVAADSRFLRQRKEPHIHQNFENGAGSAAIKCPYVKETED